MRQIRLHLISPPSYASAMCTPAVLIQYRDYESTAEAYHPHLVNEFVPSLVDVRCLRCQVMKYLAISRPQESSGNAETDGLAELSCTVHYLGVFRGFGGDRTQQGRLCHQPPGGGDLSSVRVYHTGRGRARLRVSALRPPLHFNCNTENNQCSMEGEIEAKNRRRW
jgi:hypothetical protein